MASKQNHFMTAQGSPRGFASRFQDASLFFPPIAPPIKPFGLSPIPMTPAKLAKNFSLAKHKVHIEDESVLSSMTKEQIRLNMLTVSSVK